MKGLQIRIPNLSRSHLRVRTEYVYPIPTFFDEWLHLNTDRAFSACGSVSLGVVLESCFAHEDVAPGPSILTRILESSSGEPLATKLELWSHQYGMLLLWAIL